MKMVLYIFLLQKETRERIESSSSNSSQSIDELYNLTVSSPLNSPKTIKKISTPIRQTIASMATTNLCDSSSEEETLAEDLPTSSKMIQFDSVKISYSSILAKCQGFDPKIPNIYANYPFQIHESIKYEIKYVFENGCFHTESCYKGQYRLGKIEVK